MEVNKVLNLTRIFTNLIVFGLALTLSSATFATGDPEAGKAKTTTCVACHNEDGNSTIPEFPKLAGQVPSYIENQLVAYKSGKRPSTVMMSMIQNLSEQDMKDIDAYYAQFEMSKATIEESEVAAAERGRVLYRQGQTQYAIPACMACHGPAGDGIPVRYPKVAGQFKEYLAKSLLEFKTGQRINEEMNTIAFRLSLQQIDDLAVYMQALD